MGRRFALLLLLLAALAANIVTSIPACPGLVVRAIQNKREVEPGETVRFTVNVRNAGPAASAGMSVSISSKIVSVWKTRAKASPIVDGTSVYWLNQNVLPGGKKSYQVQGEVCADVAGNIKVEANVYRLNATGGVACMTVTYINPVRALPPFTLPPNDGKLTGRLPLPALHICLHRLPPCLSALAAVSFPVPRRNPVLTS